MRDLQRLFDEQLREEYGFEVHEMDQLVEAAQWVIDELGVAPDDYIATLVTQGISTGFELGWNEGLNALD